MPQPERAVWLERFEKQRAATDHVLALFREQRLINRVEHIFDGLAIMPDNRFLLDLKKNAIEYFLLRTKDKNAEREVDTLLQKRPDLGMGWLFKSWFLVVANNLDAAENAIGKALYHEPENPLAHYTMGNIHLLRENFDMAIQEYLRALERDPNMFEANANIARVYETRGNLEMAVKYYEKALEQNPELPQIKQRLTELRARMQGKKSAN